MKNISPFLLKILFISIFVILGFIFWRSSLNLSEPVQSSVFNIAPNFKLLDFEKKPYEFLKDKNKITLIHFWASWCEPCLEEIPKWIEMSRSFQNKPVQFVAISEDKNWLDAHTILPHEKLLPNMISLLDQNAQVANEWGSYQFPETYIVNSESKILMKWVGPQEWQLDMTRNWIQKWIDKQN